MGPWAMPGRSHVASAAAGVRIGLLILAWTAVVLTSGTTQADAQLRGVDLGLGLTSFLHDQHERWPALGGRVRLGPSEAPVEIALGGTAAFAPVWGGSWSEVAGTVMSARPSVTGRPWFWGAGYSVIQIDEGAGSGSAHGAHALFGLNLAPRARRAWSLEGRLLVGPSRERQDGGRDPVRAATVLVSHRWHF